MKASRRLGWIIVVASCLAVGARALVHTQSGAGAPSQSLTEAKAQAAITAWTDGAKGPALNGAAVVLGLRETNGQNYAVADLRVRNFPDEDGHTSPSEDPAVAVFSRQTDGTWALSAVVWDFGRRTAIPDFEAR